jgi:hypothetical protein
MSGAAELPSTSASIKYAGEQVRNAKDFAEPVVDPAKTILLFYSKWANYRYREQTDWLHDAQFGYWKLLRDMSIPTRVICEDNLGENLASYKGIVMAFSPMDLMPKKDQETLRKIGIPMITDISSTPNLRPTQAQTISGEAGQITTPGGLSWNSMLDLSILGQGFTYGLKCDNKNLLAYRPKLAILGFPLGYYYLHGADEQQCRAIMRFALEGTWMFR